MVSTVRLGIVGGSGWLGQAFARAALDTGLCEPSDLTLSNRSGTCPAADLSRARWVTDNQALADASEVVIVSVRPEQYADVRLSAPGALVVSLMAGVPMSRLAERSGTAKVVRAIPNAAASIGRSFTPYVASEEVRPDEKAIVRRILTSCGTSAEIRDESELDFFTALTGAGPALPALLADAMFAHAVARGISPDLALQAVRSIVVDAAQLLADADPSALVETFLTYRGTTAAGIDAMIRGNYRQIVATGLDRMEAQVAHLTD